MNTQPAQGNDFTKECSGLVSYGKFLEIVGWLAILGSVVLTLALMTTETVTVNVLGTVTRKTDPMAGLAQGVPIVIAAVVLAAFGRGMRVFGAYAGRETRLDAQAPPGP